MSILNRYVPFLRFGRKDKDAASAPTTAFPPSPPDTPPRSALPTAEPAAFDLVHAAEALLENAKRLESAEAADQENLRRMIAMSAKKITSETMPAMDALMLEWLSLCEISAWRLFMEWKAFDHIPVGGSISTSDLAKALDAQESLVARIANFLVATGRLQLGEKPGHIRHSRISPLYMSSHPVSDLNAVALGNGFKSWLAWPEYFKKYGRREAPDVTNTPFSFAWGHPELPPWEVKALYPEYAAQFARTMKSRKIVGGDMKLVGPEALFDFSWLGAEAKTRTSGQPVVVDVGGGMGQLLKDVLMAIPGVSAKQCVLQDRKEVLEEAAAAGDPVLKEVVMMEHDFHTAQPVKGASVYFLRRILLDYPDALAVGILRQLAHALPADNPKARIVIMEEQLLTPPTPQNRNVDMMMLSLGGKLRDEWGMRDIASQAGLSVRYHARPGNPTCVVECWRA